LVHGEERRPPEEPQHAVQLSSEDVLRLVVMPDEQGRYHFDEMGYLAGPLAPDEAERYRNSLAQQECLRRSVPA